MSKININDINVDFGENDKLKDEHLMKLFSRAYKGEKICRFANIKMDAIEPFTNYNPEVSEEFRNHFLKVAKEGEPIPIFVYQKDKKFIMSDDYNAYSLYKELGFNVVPCIVIGEISDINDVLDIGEPFELEKPTIQVVN